MHWGLLLPICYRGENDPEDCWDNLSHFFESLGATTSLKERAELKIYVGIDQYDLQFDKSEAREKISALADAVQVPAVSFSLLRSHFRSKLCHIWSHLAHQAVGDGSDLFVLLGDDIRFLSPGWKSEIERQFEDIAAKRRLPLGFGCVCFRDISFKVFPTFPVIHRSHMDAFGSLFPQEFVNQHGDPYLFELYRRWGASEFAKSASLENKVGGAGAARYTKQTAHWRDQVLTDGIHVLEVWLQQRAHHDSASSGHVAARRVHCLNVVVPSFRCHVPTLRALAALDVRGSLASVHILIVVDDPGTASLQEVQALQDWSPGHLVRVYVQPYNMGASLSRNAGMAQSFGDWTVLLDDDVTPETDLLDAYLGATLRHPGAKIFVGLTKFPEPKTILQQAVVASQMTFFYNISQRSKHPPWGVSANLCVQGRVQNTVWFSSAYPKSGGGEDIDFCLRMKAMQPHHLRESTLVSVPEAVVHHPFWPDIFGQIIGWAQGDALCLEALPHSRFYAPPNWIEAIFLVILASAFRLLPTALGWQQAAACLLCIFLSECLLDILTVMPNTPRRMNPLLRIKLAALAILPAMAQDVARLRSKLLRGRIILLFCNFDWMDGHDGIYGHITMTRLGLLFRNMLWTVLLFCCIYWGRLTWTQISLCATFVTLLILLWSSSQRFDARKHHDELTLRSLTGLPPLPLMRQIAEEGGPRLFLVLAYQRTGSNLLCGKLHNHAQILMHNEMFNGIKCFSYLDIDRDPAWGWDIFSRDRDPQGFVADLMRYRPPPGSTDARLKSAEPRAVGFKLFPEHWTPSAHSTLQRLVADPNVKKIILRRSNYLDVYASKLRADKSGSYVDGNLDHVDIAIDPAAFESFVEHYDACYEYYDKLISGQSSESVLRLDYDDLTAAKGAEDPEETMCSVFRFLGADPPSRPLLHSLGVDTVKQTREPLADHIVNYDEVRYAFSCTKIAGVL